MSAPPSLPEWASEQKAAPPKINGHAAYPVGPHNLDHARDLLYSIHPDVPHDDWMHSMAAFNHESGGSAEGLAIFDSWSAQGSKYPGPADVEYRWNSFTPGKGLTVGTLAKIARDHGADLSEIAKRHHGRSNRQEAAGNVSSAYSVMRHDHPGGAAGHLEPDMSVIQRNTVAVPAFPTDVFGPAAQWVEDTAKSKSAPVDYVSLGLLVATAGMIGSKRRVAPWDGWTEPSILWGALVGPPSSNKSPPMDPIRDAVQAIEALKNADWANRQSAFEAKKMIAEAHFAQWEQDVSKAVKTGSGDVPMPPEAQMPKAPTRDRVWMVDCTTEQVARMLGENSAGLICFRDELAGLLGSFDRYGGSGSDRAFWLEAYGGRPYRFDRVSLKGEGIDIPFCSVSLLGGLQPDRLNSMLLSGDDDGLPARLLYAWPDPVRSQRPTRTPDDHALRSALKRLSDLTQDADEDGTPRSRIIFLSSEAADDFQAWWEHKQWDAKMNAGGRLAGAVGKLDGITLRLAQTIEFLGWAWIGGNEEPSTISLESVKRAMRIVDGWARANIQRVFAEAALREAQRDAMDVGKWLQRTKPKQVNARELRRTGGFTGPKEPKRLDAAIEMLIDCRWLTPVANVGAHRPRKDYTVNPKIIPKEI